MSVQRAKGERVKVQRAQGKAEDWASGTVHYCVANFPGPAVTSQMQVWAEGRSDQ